MRPIVRPDGTTYCEVEVRDGKLNLYLRNGTVVVLDAKIVPQLRQLLAEAEFLKCL